MTGDNKDKWGQVSTLHTFKVKCGMWRPDPIILIALILCVLSPAFAQDAQQESVEAQEVSAQAAEPAPAQPQITSVGENGAAKDAASAGIKIDKKKISLDLKGIDVTELFRILSVKMNLTIVPTKSVTGRINIFLNNLTFDDALDVILLSQDLACDKRGSIINIMTADEYEKLYGRKYNEKRSFRSVKLAYAKPATAFNALGQVKSEVGKVIVDEATGIILMIDTPEKLDLMEATIKDLDRPPQTEVFDIKYAKAADIKTHLSAAITTGPGEVFVDDRSGKVVVSDLPDKMKKIKRMFKAFDSETKQVFIESEIVQVTLKKEYQRGINWEKLFKGSKVFNLDFKGTFGVNPSWTPSPSLSTSNLAMTVGTMAADKFTIALSWLDTFGDAKIISSPRLAIVNNQEAKILVGSREAYITSSQSQASDTTVTSESVQFIDVGIKLNIVPVINEDGYVIMKIKPEVSSVRETLTSSLGSKIPIVETSEVETMVKIKDGTMIMIGGLIKEDKRKDESGIPLLYKIPFIGSLWGSRADLNKKTEMVIFITPHIIRGDTPVGGTKLEEIVPPEITSDQMQKTMISDILLRESRAAASAGKKGASGPGKITVNPAPRVNKEAASIDMQSKMKGLKEY